MKHPIKAIERLFPSIICRTQSGNMHLTFDDGPHPIATPMALDILKQHHILATFFLLGKNIWRYPDLVYRIHEEGHTIGNHTYTHGNLFWRSQSYVRNELQQTNDAIRNITHKEPRLFRPPYGYFRPQTLSIAKELSLHSVLWTYDLKDYMYTKSGALKRIDLTRTRCGEIILMHDNEQTVRSLTGTLEFVINELSARNYSFSAIEL